MLEIDNTKNNGIDNGNGDGGDDDNRMKKKKRSYL